MFDQAPGTLFGLPNGPKHVSEHPWVPKVPGRKPLFWPFFDPLLIPKRGISRGFGAKWSLRMAANSLKTGSECVSEHPKWSRVIFYKALFFDPLSAPKWAI